MRTIDADSVLKKQRTLYDEYGASYRAVLIGDIITAATIKTPPTPSKWIDVNKHLPDAGERVLILGLSKSNPSDTIITITHMSDKNFINPHIKTNKYWIAPFQYFFSTYQIQYWMHLPEAICE